MDSENIQFLYGETNTTLGSFRLLTTILGLSTNIYWPIKRLRLLNLLAV